MTKLEENNLNTQLDILRENKSDNNMITHYVAQKAATIRSSISGLQKVDGNLIISKENYTELIGFLSNLSNPTNWYLIHEYCKEYQLKINIRNEILNKLNKDVTKL